MNEKIPAAVVTRLSLYSRFLKKLEQEKRRFVCSEHLAQRFGYTDAQVRKDLSYFGQFGVAGKGYEVRNLRNKVTRILGTDRKWEVVLVGLGNLGQALFFYKGFKEHGFNVIAVFDKDPAKIGKRIGGVTVQSIEELEKTIRQRRIKIGIIAVPALAAQEVADRFIEAGVEAILNFSPAQVVVPQGVLLRNVDLSIELENLTYFLARKDGAHSKRQL